MPTTTTSEAALVRDFFERVSNRQSEVLLPGTTGTYLVDITDAGRWYLVVRDGRVTSSETPIPADCAMICTASDFVRLIEPDDILRP
jgi:hypothetical protein